MTHMANAPLYSSSTTAGEQAPEESLGTTPPDGVMSGAGPWVHRRSSDHHARRRVAALDSFYTKHPSQVETADVSLQPAPRRRSERACRAMNLTVALAALVVLAPLLLLIALAVRLSSPGPILYTQTRIGLNRRRNRFRPLTSAYDRRLCELGGQPFRLFKFRTMTADAERGTGARWASRNDPRVTALGRVLRKTRLDELPQLFNVVRGEMNIVGPRPERPSIFASLCDQVERYPLRQRVKPGITGLAQISNPYDESIDDVRNKVHHDLEYQRRQGVLEDLRIMALTIPVMLLRKGGW